MAWQIFEFHSFCYYRHKITFPRCLLRRVPSRTSKPIGSNALLENSGKHCTVTFLSHVLRRESKTQKCIPSTVCFVRPLSHASIHRGIVVLVCFVDLLHNSWFICFCSLSVTWYTAWAAVRSPVIPHWLLAILCSNSVLSTESDRLKDTGVLSLALRCV